MFKKWFYPISILVIFIMGTNAFADLLSDPDLVIYYSFDKVTDIVADQSGHGLDGVVKGDVSADPDGKRNGAAKFEGTGGPTGYSYLDLDGPHVPSQYIPTNAITLAAWGKVENTGGDHAIFNAQAADATWVIHPEFRSNGQFRWLLRSYGEVTMFDIRAGTVTWGEWQHYAGTYDKDSGKAKLYINGELVQELDVPSPGYIAGDWGTGARVGYNIDNARPFTGLMDMLFMFKRALSQDEILKAMQGEAYPYSLNPSPKDGSYVENTWITLSWSPGDYAVSHDIYMGDNYDDVYNGTGDTFRGNQALNSTFYVAGFPGYAFPDGLVPGTTYYWRIDEVNEANPDSPWKGNVWSFTVPPKTAYNPVPADGAEFVALDTTLSWTAGFGGKLHTIYLGDDFDQVNNAAGGTSQGSTTYTPSQLESGKVYYWRVDEYDGSNTYKGNVWSFTTPGAVGNPVPANGATDVKMTATLSWTAADNAASHEVYFGSDKDAVRNADKNSPEYKGSKALGAESYDPGKLSWYATYYWRVDEVDSLGNTQKGPLWSFTTADFISIDDFEDYNAGENQIWYAWQDGLGYGTPDKPPYSAGNGTGSAVGDETTASYCEETMVHGGGKSMPVAYDNNKQGYAYYSEVTKTLSYPRDWTEEGVSRLSLWFRGVSSNSPEPLYVAVANSTGTPAVVVNDNPAAAQAGVWTQWVIPLQTFAVKGIDLTDVDSIAIGLGTQGNMTTPGGSGKMYFDDISLYRPEMVYVENSSFEQPGTEKIKGFNGEGAGGTPAVDIPGWSTDGPCVDSGVETGYTPTDGDWTAFLKSGDPSVWQLTNHTITDGDVLVLKVDSRITWIATTLRMTIYYDDNGTRVPAATSDVTLTDAMQEYSLSFSANDVPESVGHKVGIEFSNVSSGGDSWLGLDNVRLELAGI
jgi:hypothetical protein